MRLLRLVFFLSNKPQRYRYIKLGNADGYLSLHSTTPLTSTDSAIASLASANDSIPSQAFHKRPHRPQPPQTVQNRPRPPQTVQKRRSASTKVLLNFLLRVLYEPVFPLMQAVQNRTKRLEKVQVNFLPRMYLEPSAGKRTFIEPPAGKKVLLEPVVATFPQTVQNRIKRLEKPQIKISARAHIEPDVG